MSKLKITAPGLYSMVFGLLLTFTLGCGDKKKEVDSCATESKEDCAKAKQKDGASCKWDNGKCVAEKKATLLQEDATTCQKLDANACLASRDCTFDADKNACNDAAVKNACVNIQSKEVCDKDTTCGGWDGKVCKDKAQGNNPNNPNQPNQPNQPTTEKKSVKVFTVKQILPAHIASPRVDKVAVSGDKNWAYFVSNNNARLTTFNMEGADKVAANIKAGTKWNTKANLETGLADEDEDIATANLTGGNVILSIQATQKGAVISTQRNNNDGHRGAAYLEGADYKAAWKNDGNAARDVENIANLNQPFFGVVLSKASGEQYMSVFGPAGGVWSGMTNNVDLNTAAEPKVRLDIAIERGAHDALFHGRPGVDDLMAPGAPLSAPGYLVDVRGITVLPEGLGKIVAAEGDAPNLGCAKLKADTLDLRSDLWQIAKGKDNNYVSSVVAVNGVLYIGLGSKEGGYRGGVAVFNPALELGKRTTAPHGSWHKVNVVHLTVDKEGNVWAVTPKGLIKVKPDTTQDGKIDKALVDAQQFTDEFDTETDNTQRFFGMMPSFDQVSSAEWVGDHLMITTLNEGAWFFNHEVKSLIKKTPAH